MRSNMVESAGRASATAGSSKRENPREHRVETNKQGEKTLRGVAVGTNKHTVTIGCSLRGALFMNTPSNTVVQGNPCCALSGQLPSESEGGLSMSRMHIGRFHVFRSLLGLRGPLTANRPLRLLQKSLRFSLRRDRDFEGLSSPTTRLVAELDTILSEYLDGAPRV